MHRKLIPTAFVALCLVVFPAAALAQTAPADPVRLVRISGRLVDPSGRAIRFGVDMAEIDPPGLMNATSVQTDSLGIFTFFGKPSKQYRLYVETGYKTTRKTVDTASGEDVEVGDMVVEPCPPPVVTFARGPPPAERVGDLRLEQIVIEPQSESASGLRSIPLDLPRAAGNASPDHRVNVELPQCWAGPSLERREEWEPLCLAMFDHWISVESFVGGRVDKIRVVRCLPYLTTAAKLREELRKVWLGTFKETSCGIDWDEASLGNVEASIEFEDGKRSSLVTDGGHVRVQDRTGKYWFMRLAPAVQ